MIKYVTMFLLMTTGMVLASSILDEYDNVGFEPKTAYSSFSGFRHFGEIPFDLKDLNTIVDNHFMSFTMKQTSGGDYIYSRTRENHVDPLKSLVYITKIGKYYPIVAYSAPYRVDMSVDGNEIMKKRDEYLLGIINTIDDNLGYGITTKIGNSLYRIKENDRNYYKSFTAISHDIIAYYRHNDRIRIEMGYTTPFYAENSFDNSKDKDYSYLIDYIASVSFEYTLFDFEGNMTFCYEKMDNENTDELNENIFYTNMSLLYKMYDYLSLGCMVKVGTPHLKEPKVLNENEKMIGLFLGYKYSGTFVNISFTDSNILSIKEYGKSGFQIDFGINF